MPNLLLRPSNENPDLLELGTPFFNLLFGPADDTGGFAIGIDLGGDGLVTTRAILEIPAEFNGAKPVYQFHIDGHALMHVVEIVAGMAPDPSAKQAVQEFMANLPEDNITLDVAGTFVEDRHVTLTRVTNLKTLIDLLQPEMSAAAAAISPIEREDLRAFPVDSRITYIGSQDVGIIIDSMITQAEQQSNGEFDPEDVFIQIQEEIGIHPIDDLIAHLGTRWGAYTSLSTGGGGFLSGVFFNAGINAEKLHETFEHLCDTANSAAESEAMGYVRCQPWSPDGMPNGFVSGWTLTFPGIPVPLELSMALTNDHLIAGLTPQATRVAVAQATGATKSSLLDNPRFRAETATWPDDVADFAFTDTPAAIDRGYPMTQLLGSALANFVRSPSDSSRDPGPVVPPYHELADGAHAWTQVSFMQGDDFVEITTTDASWLVNIAGTCGAIGLTPELIGATALGAAIGANAR
jgi:hypothetical protein